MVGTSTSVHDGIDGHIRTARLASLGFKAAETNDYIGSMDAFESCLKMPLSHIGTKRLTAAHAANSKRFTNVLDVKSVQYAGGKMMVKIGTTQVKCAAGQMAH